MEKELSRDEAIKLSIIKWEYIVNNRGSAEGLRDAHPELIDCFADCGLCQYTFFTLPAYKQSCNYCPLAEAGYECFNDDGDAAFERWGDSKSKEDAMEVLNNIKSLKTNE